jgi:hypothetical protein
MVLSFFCQVGTWQAMMSAVPTKAVSPAMLCR